MKTFIRVFVLFALLLPAFGQTLPTNGLVIQYDMLTTGGGGTTLTDLSGNGNNGTLNGTTTNAQGRIFNGTTDNVTVPKLIGNSDFTAMAIFQQPVGGSSTGALWSESDGTSNCGSASCIRFSPGGGSTILGSGGTVSFNNSTPTRNPDFDVYVFSRQQELGYFNMISRAVGAASNVQNFTLGAAKFGAHATVTTSNAALGMVFRGAGNVSFISGNLAYFVLYNRALSQSEVQQVYQYMAAQVLSRPVFVHPFPTFPNYTKPVWQRQGQVFSHTFPGAAQACTEPTVIYDNNLQIISTTSGFGFKMICSEDGGTLGEYYGESADGFSWTFDNTSITGTNVIRGSLIRVGNTYHLFGEHAATNLTFDHYTSPNGRNSWTLSQAGILSTGTGFESSKIDNPMVVYDAAGLVGTAGTWYMTYDGFDGTQFREGGATSTDPAGNVWTKVTANPISGAIGDPYPENDCEGSDTHIINGAWYLWCGNFAAIKRYYSPVFNGLWIWNQRHSSLVGTQYNETNQLGDESLVEAPCPATINPISGSRCVFMFYWPAGQNSGHATGINLAIANMPFSELVQTNEGATTDWP